MAQGAAAAPAPSTANNDGETRALLARNQWIPAEANLRARLKHDPSSAEAHNLLGFTLFHEGRATDSLAEYTQGAKFATPTSDDLLVVASDYILLKDYPDAQHWLSYILEHSPENQLAWYLLGRTQYSLDRAEDALHSFDRSLLLHPRDVRSEYNRGLVLERLERNDDALQAYQLAITWDRSSATHDPQPYLDLGSLLLKLDRPADARDILRSAVTFDPGNPMAQQQFGIASERAGDLDTAIAAYRRASELAPAAQHPHYFLGRLLRRMGRKAEADEQFAIVSRLLASSSSTETPNFDHLPSGDTSNPQP